MKKILALVMAIMMIVSIIPVQFVAAEGSQEPVPEPAANTIALETMSIVLPAEATDVEQSAASELKSYIKKMTGTEPAVVTEGAQSGNAIYIGATAAATAAGVTFEDTLYDEGWAIKAQDGSLYLVGGETRGVLYAVYHLLEDVFGVRWWNMWEEYVPS